MVGAWPKEKSIQRAMKYDGILPNFIGSDGKVKLGQPLLKDVQDMTGYLHQHADPDRHFDIIMEGETDPDKPDSLEIVRSYQTVGATWWIEASWNAKESTNIINRIKAGPPRV
jgi:hypothetical protein